MKDEKEKKDAAWQIVEKLKALAFPRLFCQSSQTSLGVLYACDQYCG
jgi:hypothetical protein